MTEIMRWRMVGYMLALFVAGAVTGATVMARTGSQTLKVGRTEEIAGIIRLRCERLDLTPEQKEKFEPLIKKASTELEKSHMDCLQECAKSMDDLYAQIRLSLTPDQVAKLTKLDEERHATIKQKYNYPTDGTQVGNR